MSVYQYQFDLMPACCPVYCFESRYQLPGFYSESNQCVDLLAYPNQRRAGRLFFNRSALEESLARTRAIFASPPRWSLPTAFCFILQDLLDNAYLSFKYSMPAEFSEPFSAQFPALPVTPGNRGSLILQRY